MSNVKEIYTSYLNRRGVNWTELGFTRIRICRWVVHESQHERYDCKCEELFPTEDQIKNFDQFETRDAWVKSYTELILDKLNPQEFYDSLPDKCVLLCHEKPEMDGDVLCHRRLVADWLTKNCGAHIPEWLPAEQLAKIEQQRQKDEMINSLLEF